MPAEARPSPEPQSLDPAPFDQALLDPTRFSIVSLLAAAHWAEFGFVRDCLGVSDSALSKQAHEFGGTHQPRP